MTPEEIAAMQAENEGLKAAAVELAGATGDKELRTQLESLRAEQKTLIEARDAAKTAKRAAEEAALAEQGEFKTLAETRAAELEAATKRLEESDKLLQGFNERDEATLKELLESVPEDMREMVSDETLPLPKRLVLAHKLATVKPPPPGVKAPGGNTANTITRADFEAKNPTERMAFVQGGGKVT